MNALLEKFKRMDWVLTGCILALVVMGTVFIWSAGSARQGVFQSIWITHAITAAFGLALYFAFALVDYRRLLDVFATPAYVGALVLLVAVLLFGAEIYGGRRWLWFFQPSEISKLAVILFVAHLFGRSGRESFKWFLAGALVLGVPALLILKEPDLGTALVLVPAGTAMFLAARVWTKGLVALLLVGLLAAGTVLGTVFIAEQTPDPARRAQIYAYLPLRAHQLKRLRVFLFPDRDLRGAGYNLRQAQISIGSGSVWGKGLRKGSQKTLGYLPPSVSMNDFIFAALAEALPRRAAHGRAHRVPGDRRPGAARRRGHHDARLLPSVRQRGDVDRPHAHHGAPAPVHQRGPLVPRHPPRGARRRAERRRPPGGGVQKLSG